MIVFVSVFAVWASTAICFEYTNTNISVMLTPESKIVPEGEVLTLTCNTTLPGAVFPQWMLNENTFSVTHLPLGFTANKSSLQFTFDGDDVDIRCVFRILYGGSVINICSNPSRIRTDGARGELTTDPCQNVNIISFLIMKDGLIININGVIGREDTCYVEVNLTDCAHPEYKVEQRVLADDETGAAIIYVPNATNLYGSNIMVTAQTCLQCNPLSYYLPNVRPTEYTHIPFNHMGTVIDEIDTNSYTTDCFNHGSSIDYAICIDSGDSNACYNDPCGNHKVFLTSLCGSYPNNGKIGLGVNGTENNTIVSIFCIRENDCAGTSDVMLLNTELLTCDENADYKEGQCVCRENYIGDGIVCTEQKGFGCEEVPYITLTPSSVIASIGDPVTLTCSTTLPVTIPQWEINDNLFSVTRLPRGYNADGLRLQFAFDGDVDVRCVFTRFSSGSVVNLCSTLSRVVSDGPRDVAVIKGDCENISMTFVNRMDVSTIHIIGIEQRKKNCSTSVNFTRCSDPDPNIEKGDLVLNDSDVTIITVDSISSFYRHNVTVEIETCQSGCKPYPYYLPDMQPTGNKSIPCNYTGTIINDLSKGSNCNLGINIMYTICLQLGESTECYKHPCGNGQIVTSLCGKDENDTISLELINGIENGTIISFFCMEVDCLGTYAEVMLHNFEIFVCDENAEYKNETCVCKNGYSGNGIVCVKQQGGGGGPGLGPGAIAGIVIAVIIAVGGS